MSGSTTPPPPAGGDPSMEDILASIRRILSEDEPPPGSPEATADAAAEVAPPVADEPARPVDDVLVLDPSMMVPEPQHNAPLEHRMSPEAPAESAYAAEAAAAPVPTAAATALDHAEGLVAPEAAAAAASSVGSLMRALSDRSTQVHHGGPTLEDLVRDEIRPVLKQWLDTHLPPIVERLVRIEIERVVGRAV